MLSGDASNIDNSGAPLPQNCATHATLTMPGPTEESSLDDVYTIPQPPFSSTPKEYVTNYNLHDFFFEMTGQEYPPNPETVQSPPQTTPSAIVEPILSTPNSSLRISRPPNAFMLFRSDFLKRGLIPEHVERRQQNLSRITGKCWNLFSPIEKEKWQAKARAALVEHQQRYPDYKSTPSPRATKRGRRLLQAAHINGAEGPEERIRRIREQYTNLNGPPVPSKHHTRQRRGAGVSPVHANSQWLPSTQQHQWHQHCIGIQCTCSSNPSTPLLLTPSSLMVPPPPSAYSSSSPHISYLTKWSPFVNASPLPSPASKDDMACMGSAGLFPTAPRISKPRPALTSAPQRPSTSMGFLSAKSAIDDGSGVVRPPSARPSSRPDQNTMPHIYSPYDFSMPPPMLDFGQFSPQADPYEIKQLRELSPDFFMPLDLSLATTPPHDFHRWNSLTDVTMFTP